MWRTSGCQGDRLREDDGVRRMGGARKWCPTGLMDGKIEPLSGDENSG